MAQVVYGPYPAKSPYLVYDEYIEQTADGNRLVFVDPGMGISDFKSKYDTFHIIDMWSKDGSGKEYLPGERSRKSHDVAAEVSKQFGRSLLKKLKNIEADGKCIEDFTLEKISVYPSGKVKLKVTLLSKEDLGAQFEVVLRQNYRVARRAIRSLFVINGARHVPPDVKHLLWLMVHCFEARAMFPEHASIVHLMARSSMFKDLHDLVKVRITWPQYHAICDAIITDMGGADWRKGVRKNYLLSETYFYRGGSEYDVPKNSLNQRRLRKDQVTALNAIHLASSSKELTSFEARVIDGHKLLTLLRNRYAHRLEAVAAGWLSWNQQKIDYRPAHTEVVTMVKFHRVLAVLQFELYQMGYLNEPDLLC